MDTRFGGDRGSGFTLLELLIVLVVLGLLASLVGPRYFKQLGQSESKTARAQIEALSRAVDLYRLDVGRFPSSAEGLRALVERPPSEPRWKGPYLQKDLPADPWGRPYQYHQPGQRGDYDIFTFGKDGAPGGEDDNADIGNWS